MTWVCPDRGVKDQHMPSIIDIRWNILWDLQQTHILVGGFNPSETYWSVGMIVPNIWRKKTPTSIYYDRWVCPEIMRYTGRNEVCPSLLQFSCGKMMISHWIWGSSHCVFLRVDLPWLP